MADVTKLNIGGVDYDIVDASVPSWAKQSTKPTYTASEVGAAEALNVTEAHKAAIMAMDNVEDIQEYDITDGYPEKLDLSVEFLTKLA